MPLEQQTENLIPAPNLDYSVEKSIKSTFFSLGEWPHPHWWELFHSDVLTTLIVEALYQNPSIQEVKARIHFASQEAIIARSRFFPFVFLKGDDDWQYLSKHGLYRALNPKIPLNANLVDLTLSFAYEFDFWGKNAHLFRSALGEVMAREAETAQVQLITSTAIAQTYFALKTNLMRKHLYEKLVEVRSRIFQLQHLLLEKALFSKLSPLFAQETVFEAKKLLASIEEEIAANKHLINILAGRGPDTPLDTDERGTPLPKQVTLPATRAVEL